MAAPVPTTPDAQDPTAAADPIALAAFVSRRGGRVLAYLDAVTQPDLALRAAGEAFASFRLARAADPEAEAAATTLLRATRRAATAHAENPYRPVGRERPARRTAACDAMPRLLVAWTEARLPESDVARLVEHLQACPDCRALRDAFDRAELGYRSGTAAELDGTEVGVIATAMALAVGPPAPGSSVTAAPAVEELPGRRAGVPARSDGGRTDDAPRRTALPATRRTEIPAPPAAVPGRPTAVPARPRTPSRGPTAVPDRPTAIPERPRTVPGRPAAEPDRSTAAPQRSTGVPERPPATPDGATGVPDDPLGPEALGYAVPRSGLPRPVRRPAVPRVRRPRRRRPPAAAVAAVAAVEVTVAAVPTEDEAVRPRDGDASSATGSDAPRTRDDDRVGVAAAPVGRADDRDARPAVAPATATTVAPATVSTVPPATVTSGGLAATGRRVLEIPIVRELGVPALLLLAVLIAALIAAGVFAGQQEESVPPITRPTIPTVPADPSDIPSLR